MSKQNSQMSNRIAAFAFKSLKLNLDVGRGAGIKLPSSTTIKIVFGSQDCPALGPLSSFYVNELPRLYRANESTLDVETEQSKSSCLIEIKKIDRTETIELKDCSTAAAIYARVMSKLI